MATYHYTQLWAPILPHTSVQHQLIQLDFAIYNLFELEAIMIIVLI